MKKLLLICFILVSFGAQSHEGFQSNCKIIDIAGKKLEGLKLDCDKKRVRVEFVDQQTEERIRLKGDLLGGDSINVQFDDYYWLQEPVKEIALISKESCNEDEFNSAEKLFVTYLQDHPYTNTKAILAENPDALFISYNTSDVNPFGSDYEYYPVNQDYIESGSEYKIGNLVYDGSYIYGCVEEKGYYSYKWLKGYLLENVKTIRSESMINQTLTDPLLSGLHVVPKNNKTPE